MTLLPYLMALGAALLLLGAGYLSAVRKGAQARQSLRQLNRGFAKEIALLRDQAAMPRVNDEGLRATLQDILSPLVQRERLSYEMSRLESGKGQQRNLTAVLDQMADKGNFSSVLLSDAQGWRIAASSSTQDAEKLGATASLLWLMADRLSLEGPPTPLALMLSDPAHTIPLCPLRIVICGAESKDTPSVWFCSRSHTWNCFSVSS